MTLGSNPGRAASELWQFRLNPTLPVSFRGDTINRHSLLSGVYARGTKISHTGGKCVTCHGLHNSEINHSGALPLEWADWSIPTKHLRQRHLHHTSKLRTTQTLTSLLRVQTISLTFQCHNQCQHRLVNPALAWPSMQESNCISGHKAKHWPLLAFDMKGIIGN